MRLAAVANTVEETRYQARQHSRCYVSATDVSLHTSIIKFRRTKLCGVFEHSSPKAEIWFGTQSDCKIAFNGSAMTAQPDFKAH
jgi:hypothetical protein